jgi:hypothetical protein
MEIVIKSYLIQGISGKFATTYLTELNETVLQRNGKSCYPALMW